MKKHRWLIFGICAALVVVPAIGILAGTSSSVVKDDAGVTQYSWSNYTNTQYYNGVNSVNPVMSQESQTREDMDFVIPDDAVVFKADLHNGEIVTAWHAYNENGEIYGIDYAIDALYAKGLELDLGLAEGENGRTGYVRHYKPEEAEQEEYREYVEGVGYCTFVNVYESNGVTVIDRMRIGNPTPFYDFSEIDPGADD